MKKITTRYSNQSPSHSIRNIRASEIDPSKTVKAINKHLISKKNANANSWYVERLIEDGTKKGKWELVLSGSKSRAQRTAGQLSEFSPYTYRVINKDALYPLFVYKKELSCR
jgi:hypothetical protein